MNVGLRGLSMSLGPRGSNINISPRGTYANLGVPGTGLSTRNRVGAFSRRSSRNADLAGLKIAFRLQEDGTIEIVGEDGSELPQRAVKIARDQNEERLRLWLEEKCDHWNKGINGLLGIHLKTPRPDRPPPDADRQVFSKTRPSEPLAKPLTFLAQIFKARRERIERENADAREQYAKDVSAWERACDEHDRLEAARLRIFDSGMPPDPTQIQEYLSEVLGRVEWPRETTISLEVDDTVTRVMVDVDLPEIEDMPDKEARVAARGLKLNVKDRSATQRRREYLVHVHGVAFRVLGEIFAALPRIERVAVSGYSQRANSTGQVSDDYIFSIRVMRSTWIKLNFSRLADLDLPTCLGTFDIRRNMTSTAVLKPIEPFTSLDRGG